MVLSRLLEGISGLLIENLLGRLFYSVATADWSRNEWCFSALLALATFFGTLAVARLIGSKSWMALENRPLFTRRATLEALMLSATVLGFYGIMRQFDSSRENVLNVVALLSSPVYGIWIYASVKRLRNEISAV